MKTYTGKTFAEVYKKSLSDLYNNPEYVTSPRDLNIKENAGVSLLIQNPISNMYMNNRRGSQFEYIAGELLFYFLGRNDTEYISKFSKFWKNIENEDGTVNSAYGNLIFNELNEFEFTQYDWALTSLIKDKDSRQAIMHFNSKDHQYLKNKDFVCTMYSIFQIRENKLNFKVYMRSNDAILGTPTDVAFFTVLQMQALNHLREVYPELELGTYEHVIDSYHIYDRHFGLVKEMLSNDFVPVEFPKLKLDLINNDGSPTKNLLKLDKFKYIDKLEDIHDIAYYWIHRNINKKQ